MIYKVYKNILFLSISCPLFSTQKLPKKMIIAEPVVDLRTAPQATPENLSLPTNDITNPYQCSQMLLGEYIIAHKQIVNQNGQKWLSVSALQQPKYTNQHGWKGFFGWIQPHQAYLVDSFPAHNIVIKNFCTHLYDKKKSIINTISIGTRLQGTKELHTNFYKVILPNKKTAWVKSKDVYELNPLIQETTQQLQKNITTTALQFLGSYYSWGGRSAQCENFGISSVDCSSFMQLVFLANGFQIPRNAHDQFLTTTPVLYGKNLQPGDLVFFDPIIKHQKPPVRISHVLLYLGDNKLIEATNSGDRKVRIISFDQRIGKPLSSMKSGDISKNVTTRGKIAGQYHIYFGSYLQDPKKISLLRSNALNQYNE